MNIGINRANALTQKDAVAYWRRLAVFASGVLLVLLAIETYVLVRDYFGPPGIANLPSIGADQQFYRDVGLRFLAEGQYLHPHQLQGPHDQIPGITVLYPPTALFLFVPLALLPDIVWWIVPIALLAFALYRLRPAPWTWVVMLALLMWPRAIGAYLVGNTDMWAVAFIALGIQFGWPAVLLAVKPLYLPFALVGIRRRSTWVAGLILGAVSLLMLPLWFQYIQAMLDMRVDATYWAASIPLLVIPLVAWLGKPVDDGSRRGVALRSETHGVVVPLVRDVQPGSLGGPLIVELGHRFRRPRPRQGWVHQVHGPDAIPDGRQPVAAVLVRPGSGGSARPRLTHGKMADQPELGDGRGVAERTH